MQLIVVCVCICVSVLRLLYDKSVDRRENEGNFLESQSLMGVISYHIL